MKQSPKVEGYSFKHAYSTLTLIDVYYRIIYRVFSVQRMFKMTTDLLAYKEYTIYIFENFLTCVR